jgi:cation transport ATPase
METLCENNKRYRNQMLIWAITYCTVTYASVYTLKNAGIENFGLRTLIALLPMIPIAWVGVIIMRFIRSLDEFQQKIQLEAVVFSAVLTALLTGAYGFLEGVGYPKLDTIWILPMLMILWVVGQALARRRYQ